MDEAREEALFAKSFRALPVRTPTLPPATHTNSYVVGARDAILVEPASPYIDEIERSIAWVRALGAEGIDVVALFLTHHHEDHIGAARRMAEKLSVPVWAHALTGERVRREVNIDRTFVDGDVISLGGEPELRLTVLHTPGHAPGHLCLYDAESRTMIAGDMVAGVGTILIDPSDGDMASYLESLERMKACHPRVLLPAHGPVIRDAEARLTQYIAHRLAREAKVLDALETAPGPSSLELLVVRAYDDTPTSLHSLAMRSLESHLIKLEREGRARHQGERWSAA